VSTAALPPTEENLITSYERMAHTYERPAVDRVLRSLDITLSGVALVVLSPVIGLTAFAVRVGGGRPVLYRGQRVGRAGRVFTMYKFRTLRPDAEQRLGPFLGEQLTQLTAGEVSRLGRVLRATKLDELPQLWNVLRGDMSIVGPRPEELALVARYQPEHRFRLQVKPGMTGPMQVSGRGELAFAERLAVELDYVERVSLARDLWILLRTLPALSRGTGAF
jgi:lipopolysaccharide/colanic/teichoic acid biosynthesis glycosyltransferase